MHEFKLLTLAVLTLSVGLAADHPITISGGSPLTIEHDKWDPNPPDDRHLGSTFHDFVTRVAVTTTNGASKPIVFSSEQLDIDLTYGGIHLTVTTDSKGQNPVLQLLGSTSFKKDFHPSANQFVSNIGASSIHIDTLTVKKAGVPQPLILAPDGHTVIVICYGQPDDSSLPECRAKP